MKVSNGHSARLPPTPLVGLSDQQLASVRGMTRACDFRTLGDAMRSVQPGYNIMRSRAIWLPLAVVGAVAGGLALGYPLLVLAVFGLAICLIVCVLAYFQSKKTEGEIAAAVKREHLP